MSRGNICRNDVPVGSNAALLIQLWESFGESTSTAEVDWSELNPILDRLPPLTLVDPQVDRASAEAVISSCLKRRGVRPCPFRWFADAAAAREYDAAFAHRARPIFPRLLGIPWAYWAALEAAERFEGIPDTRLPGALRKLEEESESYDEQPELEDILSIGDELQLFSAGLFYYWIAPDEIGCIPRPTLRLSDGVLHCADGPAVEWSTGERYFFSRGVQIPNWFIEKPEWATREVIIAEPSLQRRLCMMERFGIEHFSILVRSAEWQKCRDRDDFDLFVAVGAHRDFDAVSQTIGAHGEAVIDRLTPQDFRQPRIDKDAVAASMARLFEAWGETNRPLRWFDDRSAACEYARRRSHLPTAAYWPRLRIAPLLDSVWYARNLNHLLHIASQLARLDALEDWYHWTLTNSRARDRYEFDGALIHRIQDWRFASQQVQSVYPADLISVDLLDPAVRRWTPLMEAFAAGLFCYWIGSDEVVCVPRPSLWMSDGRLHRDDGPAVMWPNGEQHYFWRGVQVPEWIIAKPEKITPQLIAYEQNIELRRCMIERFGYRRYLGEVGSLIGDDAYGKLWRLKKFWSLRHSGQTMLEVRNGTCEPDGSYRQYFVSVPPSMRNPREAVAWTYGLSAEQYESVVRT